VDVSSVPAALTDNRSAVDEFRVFARKLTDHSRPQMANRHAFGAPVSFSDCLLYSVVASVLDIAIGISTFPSVLHGSLVNPDSYMRMVRLRDIIAQHAPIHIVARDSGGAGTVLHWSHLVDGVMLLLAAPFSLFVGEDRALHWAALAFGPIAIGLLSVAVVWAMAPFTYPRWRWSAPLLAAISPAIMGFAVPGEVHHHIPVAAASVMTAGWALRAPSRGAPAGRAMGAWAAIGIWLTPESMPFILASFGGVGLFWTLHPEELGAGKALRAAGTTFFVLIAATLAIDPPFGGYAKAEIERLSIVYLVLGAMICAIGWGLWTLDRRHLSAGRRSVAGILATLIGLGLWFLAFPNELIGPYGLLDAADTRLFFGAISDMLPIHTLPDILSFLATGVLAAIAAGAIAWRNRSPLWGYAALCAALTIVLGAIHRRFGTYPEIVAVAMLPVILSAADRFLERHRASSCAAIRVAILAAFLLIPETGSLAARSSSAPTNAASAGTCDPRSLTDLLRPFAGQIVLTDPGETPAVLYWSKVLTVGSLFHLNVDAFLRLRDAWRSAPSDREPNAVRATHAALVLVCPQQDQGRSLLVSDLPKNTLLDLLQAGDPPPWLERVGAQASSGYVLYRVAK
jgi:hypothetical protein